MNNQSNRKRGKEAQLKTVYLTLSLALVMIAVLIVVTASFKKVEKDSTESSSVESVITTTDENKQVMAQTTETTEVTTTTKATTPAAETEPPEVIPTFASPIAGNLIKAHSGDTPVFSVTMNDYRPHQGVDLAGAVGDDVYAAAEGVVKEIWEDPMWGNCISISHDGNAVSIYRNLSPTMPDGLAAGTAVSKGDVIGSVGESALLEIADESHIHFEITVDGNQVDPAEFVSFTAADTNYEG